MQPDNLQPHPEGGRFQEVFRSPAQITRADGTSRSAITHIYFELAVGDVSRFHKVTSDEVWNLYEGDGVRLYQWKEGAPAVEIIELSPETRTYCHVVPAGYWQAAEPLGSACLVGCSVGPGFDFADFTMIQTGSSEATAILDIDQSLTRLIAPSVL